MKPHYFPHSPNQVDVITCWFSFITDIFIWRIITVCADNYLVRMRLLQCINPRAWQGIGPYLPDASGADANLNQPGKPAAIYV
jgi:hypothetical protein